MSRHFVAIDANGGLATYFTSVKTLTWNAIPGVYPFRVESVAEMVSKILSKLEDDKIGSILNVGHAHPGNQAVGRGKEAGSGENALFIEDAQDYGLAQPGRRELERLKNRFADDAVVTLGGCNVGDDPGGPELLKEVSKALGNVSVQGGTFYQNALAYPFLRGGITRCNSSSCTKLPWYQPRWL